MRKKQFGKRAVSFVLSLAMLIGMLPTSAFATTDINPITTNVAWSTGYTLTQQYGSGGRAQKYLSLENSNNEKKTGLFAGFFDYEIVAEQNVTNAYGTLNTVKYTATSDTEKFELTTLKTAGNSDPSGLYLKLTPKKNAIINVSVEFDAGRPAYCYYHWQEGSGGSATKKYFDFVVNKEVSSGDVKHNDKAKSYYNASCEVFADKTGYLMIGLQNTSTTSEKNLTFTINSVTEIKDEYTVKAASESTDKGTVKVVKSTNNSGSSFGSTDINGQTVTRDYYARFTAIPAEKCTFDGWYDRNNLNGAPVSTANPYDVQVTKETGDIDLVAKFTKQVTVRFGFPTRLNDGRWMLGDVAITGDSIAVGSLTGSNPVITWTGNADQQLRLVANTNTNYYFAGWYAGSNDIEFLKFSDVEKDDAKRAEYRKIVNAWFYDAELISAEREFVFQVEDYAGKTIAPLIVDGATASATFVKPVGGSITVSKWNDNCTAMETTSIIEDTTFTVSGRLATLNSNRSRIADTRWVATPDAGYRFVGWKDFTTGEMLPGGADVTRVLMCMGEITLNADHSYASYVNPSGHKITAVFERVGNVSVTFAGAPIGGSYTVNGTTIPAGGTTITTAASGSFVLKATAASMYTFGGWKNSAGTIVSKNNPYTIDAYGAEPLTPVFIDNSISVTLKKPAYGSYTISGNGLTAVTMSATSTEQTIKLNKNVAYTLTANVPGGYKFYRWTYTAEGDTLSTSASYTNTLTDGYVINVEFVKSDTAMYNVGGTSYAYLDKAISAAGSSGTITVTSSGVVYHSDGTTKTFTIQKGVQFLVPHANGAGPNESDHPTHPYAMESRSNDVKYTTAQAAPGDKDTHLTLTVPSGTTINVYGLMAIGGSSNGVGMLTGAHSDVKLESGAVINVGNGTDIDTGWISVCGFIYGQGTVNARYGGKLYMPFTVHDFKYGGYTVGVASKIADHTIGEIPIEIDHPSGEEAVMPFIRYSMMAVQCKQVLNYGAYVYGYVDLYANGQHNDSMITVFGTGRSALIKPSSGAKATITYSDTQKVNSVGRTKIVFDGNVSFGHLIISLNADGFQASMDSAEMTFPVPYNYDIVINTGTFTIPYPLQILPGATVTVNNGATLDVNASLTVYNALHDYTYAGRSVAAGGAPTVLNGFESGLTGYTKVTPNSNHIYPSTAQLTSAGLSGSGQLIVNGTLNLNSTSKFGGIIQTTGSTGRVCAYSGMTPKTTTQIGGVGYWYCNIIGNIEFSYELVGATVHKLDAQIMDATTGQRTKIIPGKTYYAVAKDFNITSYTYELYYADNNNEKKSTTKTESINIKQYGSWYNYTITWKDGNTVLKTDKVAHGTTPVAPTAPTKTSPNACTTITFSSWSPTISAAAGDITYTTTYTTTYAHYYENGVCKHCGIKHSSSGGGSSDPANGAEVAQIDGKRAYATLAQAVSAAAANDHIMMLSDSTGTVTINKVVRIDINGKNVSGVTVSADNVKFMDSAANDYGTNCGTLTAVNGSKIAAVTTYQLGNMTPKYYVKVANGNTYTFPRVAVHVTGLQFALVPSENEGYLTFRGTFRGNSQAAEKLEDVGFMFNGDNQTTTLYGGSITKADKTHFYYTRLLKTGEQITQAAAVMKLGATPYSGQSVDVKTQLAQMKDQFVAPNDWSNEQKNAFTSYLDSLIK